MKIMNRKEFLELEGDVLFSRYHDGNLGELEIKGGTFGEDDFTCQTVATSIDTGGNGMFFEELFRSEETGEELKMDFDCLGRDGLYDQNQLFAVWSAADVRGLIARLGRLDGVSD